MRRALLVAVIVALTASVASSQDASQETARRALIVDAEAASDGGDHARALDLAARAGALRMTPSLRLLIAQEQAALGQVLEALDGAERCAREAETDPAMRQREALLDECRALATRTRAQTATLSVRAPREGVVVLVDDAVLSSALFGVATPRRPGAITVRARVGDEGYFEQTATLRAGESAEVDVPPPPPTPPTPQPRPVATPIASTTVAPPPAPTTPARRASAGPWIVSATGLAAVAAGALLWWRRDVAVGDCAISGDALLCPSEASVSRAQPAAALGDSAQVSAFVGAAVAASDKMWLLLDRRAHPTRRAWWAPCAIGRTVGVCGAL